MKPYFPIDPPPPGRCRCRNGYIGIADDRGEFAWDGCDACEATGWIPRQMFAAGQPWCDSNGKLPGRERGKSSLRIIFSNIINQGAMR